MRREKRWRQTQQLKKSEKVVAREKDRRSLLSWRALRNGSESRSRSRSGLSLLLWTLVGDIFGKWSHVRGIHRSLSLSLSLSYTSRSPNSKLWLQDVMRNKQKKQNTVPCSCRVTNFLSYYVRINSCFPETTEMEIWQWHRTMFKFKY